MSEIPAALRIPQDQRNVAWIASPPRAGRAFDIQSLRPDDVSAAEFKRQVEEERRIASLNRIAKMKSKMVTGPVSVKTHRWDGRRGRWVALEPWELKSAPVAQRSEPAAHNGLVAGSSPAGGTNIDLVTKDNAERVARLNGVWKDSYGDLQAGLMTMSIKNRLKRLVKDGHAIIWD